MSQKSGAPRTLFAPKGRKKLVLDHVTYRVSDKGTVTVAAEHADEALAQGCTTKAAAHRSNEKASGAPK